MYAGIWKKICYNFDPFIRELLVVFGEDLWPNDCNPVMHVGKKIEEGYEGLNPFYNKKPFCRSR